MLIKQYNGYPMKNAKLKEIKCDNCGNTSQHFVFVAPAGIQCGFIFSKKSIGKKRFFYKCPICGGLTEEMSREVAMALKEV